MSKPRKLLVALHPGFSHTPALERARAIAEKADVELMLYSAVYDGQFTGLRFPDGETMHGTRDAMVDAEQRKLDDIKASHTWATSHVATNADWAYPAGHGIVAAAEAFNADLVIVSSTRHSALSRWALTNTDWDVLRHSTVPVLFAHHRPFRPYKTVVAAVDPTHKHDEPAQLDHIIVERARWLAGYFDGSTHLGHAYPSQHAYMTGGYLPALESTEYWLKQHSNAVRSLAAKHHIDDAHIHLLDEHPTRAIPDLARTLSADLVVMGTVSRGFLNAFMIGRTTERVLDKLECDVLTIRIPRDGT